MKGVKAGVYKHYKGGIVLVLGTARHSETEEKLVAYVPLGVQTKLRITVRPYDMFFEDVVVNDQRCPRFLYIGEELDAKTASKYDKLSGYTGGDRVDD